MRTIACIALATLLGCSAETAETPEAAVPSQTGTMTTQDQASTSPVAGEHTIEVGAAFTPASIQVAAGQPVRLHFRRGEEASCGDEVVFPDLGIREKLPPNQTTTVELPAQSAGTINFTCGMDMMKGTIVAQ